MSKYVKISLEEMKHFLETEGFIMHKKDTNTEWIANKIYPIEGNQYLIRVYTSINPEDRSRGVGTDAIHVGVFSSEGEWMFGTKRVNRTKNWQKSVKERILEIEERLQKQSSQFQSAKQL